ncbi:NUDIX hydrolase [Kozakia baliensis]|uniref:ADP-ribose pyrophosphatase n=1 Tax=Kozakia baliensis TaxID=153496 RepID=A0A1D8UQ90_9PROT|nr:NUDIX hydrolase [Kozakia baliensis]AOX15808.1 ADP-ribose pyrophosphatase [Kozakia baliensis]GBR24218.1 hydrolase [Kozakia baliensis NRIC 0488]GEL64579.1 hypothetical protein KBA01_18650 [Kozakia baliensis]
MALTPAERIPPHQNIPAFVRPVVAAIAVVLHGGRALLVRRANPPDLGMWGFPGGKIELGETLMECAVRELQEETGVTAQAVRVVTALDVFDRDPTGSVRRHFVLIAVLCRWLEGEPVAADDALDAQWFTFDEIENSGLDLSLNVVDVAHQARDLSRKDVHPFE